MNTLRISSTVCFAWSFRVTGDIIDSSPDQAPTLNIKAIGTDRIKQLVIIKNQQITGFCEWLSATSGQVTEIRVDGKNRLWMTVQRGSRRPPALFSRTP